ncbi:acyl-CoA dehydrogenase family protein [Actinomycetospora straminea]|uniref:Acyl-CoA dehydrogenase family protein n=1 Tax=Actinomycetospora straminea TaxID=663607 RepID=A0ABP9E9A4_9PSEU|nr:acyl-CoA dehydrogenase family protein [Actinomycetospora straminea]MDD7935340.1 acyl-CoA dehydrogenase family protein [Actinomycetospora straminea]
MTATLDVTEVRDAVADLLADRVTPAVLEDAEREGWAAGVWEPLHAGGFTTVGVPEAAGGAGGSVAEACAVLEAAGAASAPVPVAETGLLAGRLLAAAGIALPDGPLTTGTGEVSFDGRALSGRLARVAWARQAARIVLIADGADGADAADGADGADGSPVVAVVDPAAARITPGTNLAGEPRDAVDLDGVVPETTAPAPADAREALARRGALARAAMIAGAARRVGELTVAYTGERVQFGRPVSRFPAVADHLVRIAEQVELAAIAARSAAASARDGEPAALEVAAASAVASEAAGLVAAAAHQATGAMGVTREFALGVLTRRLWSWRDEWGGERAWSTRLGHTLAAGGPEALWPTLSRGVRG